MRNHFFLLILKKHLKFLLKSLMILLILPAHLTYADDDDDESTEQDFLFLLEEAYTQEEGEWQVAAKISQTSFQQIEGDPDSKNKSFDLGVEYGITDRLQLEFELPYQKTTLRNTNSTTNSSTVGNPEIAISYQLVQEDESKPAITAGFGVEVAASSDKAPIRSEEWGYEAFVSLSRYFDDVGFLHASLGYGIGDNGDETELSYGVGFVLPLSDNWQIQLEYLVEDEEEEEAGVTEEEKSSVLSFGTNYQFENEMILGMAYAIGDEEEIHDNSVSIKIQYEFF